MNRTSIQWTDFSANPLKYRDKDGKVVWACVHHSPGCINCYSEALAKRWHRGGDFNVQTMAGLTPFLDEAVMEKMRTYQPASGHRCFVADMTDLFGEWVPDELLNRLYSEVLEQRTDVTWQLLTKRSDRMRKYLSWRYSEHRLPSRHIWHGFSAEDQTRYDLRLREMLVTPSAVRFVSIEPQIAFLDPRLERGYCRSCKQFTEGSITGHCFDPTSPCFEGEMCIGDGLDWVIVGGESGHGARPFEIEWAQEIQRQCAATGVAFFLKQLGSVPVVAAGRPQYHEFRHVKRDEKKLFSEHANGKWRVHLVDRMGGTMTEWPEARRIRQFPKRPEVRS